MATAVVAMALVACGGDDGEPDASGTTRPARDRSTATTERSTTTTTAAPTTTASTVPAPNTPEGVLADYRAGWDAFITALTANPADPDFPALTNLFRDGALTRSQQIVARVRDEGLLGRGSVELRPRPPTINGTEAVVLDCFVDATEAVNPTTGEVVIPVDGAVPGEARLRLEGERWRTYDLIVREDLRGELCV